MPPRPEGFARHGPMLLLWLALSTVFVFGGDRGSFYRFDFDGSDGWNRPHNWDSAKVLALAENLSFEHDLRLFLRRHLAGDGSVVYDMYSRFPVGGFVLVKLAILPFGDALTAKIHAARMLMLVLFCSAATLAFLALGRLAGNRWIALAATAVAFSSCHCLYYGDAVFTEATMDLFAVMLVFHGMVVFVQEGRFRQLLAKTCVALLIGWHVYALLLPFVALGVAGEAWRTRHGGVGAVAVAVLRSRRLLLAVVAALFGTVVLAFNLVNEYFALEGATPLRELPSFRSMMRRTGLSEGGAFDPLSWSFVKDQLYRVGQMSVPYVAGASIVYSPLSMPSAMVTGIGVVTTVAALLGALFFAPSGTTRTLCIVLWAFGFCWAFPMARNVGVSTHDYEGLFYVGVPLVLVSMLLCGAWSMLAAATRWVGGCAKAACLAAALGAFGASAWQMGHTGGAVTNEYQRAIVEDFEAIRPIVRGKRVFVLSKVLSPKGFGSIKHELDFYLSGSIVVHDRRFDARQREVDFVVGRRGKPPMSCSSQPATVLTPENRFVLLYEAFDVAACYRVDAQAKYRALAAVAPAARSFFDVYWNGGDTLAYVKSPCVREDVEDRFFLQVVPVDLALLSPWRRQGEFDDLNFRFVRTGGTLFDGKCLVTAELPAYEIAEIRTGQFKFKSDPKRYGEWRKSWSVTMHPRTVSDERRAARLERPSSSTGAPASRSTVSVDT